MPKTDALKKVMSIFSSEDAESLSLAVLNHLRAGLIQSLHPDALAMTIEASWDVHVYVPEFLYTQHLAHVKMVARRFKYKVAGDGETIIFCTL